jgi:excisionase family DNA binding protein
VPLTVDEAAALLRTTRRAIYAMIERRQLPGLIRIRRRALFRTDDLLHWLDQKRTPSRSDWLGHVTSAGGVSTVRHAASHAGLAAVKGGVGDRDPSISSSASAPTSPDCSMP